MNGNLRRSKILRVESTLQRSIALHSNASWHTVELTPFEEIGKSLGIKRRRDASDQWRSQPDNLLPLCKIPSYYHYSFLYKLIVFTVSEL